MALRPLQPAIDAATTDDKLLYEWDEWKVMSYWSFVEEALAAKLDLISGRAAAALTLAIGEWICQRFSRLDSDPRPMQFSEAGWAETMQPGLGAYTDPNADDWHGHDSWPAAPGHQDSQRWALLFAGGSRTS